MQVSLEGFPSPWPHLICRYFPWKDSKWQGYPHPVSTYTPPVPTLTPSQASSTHSVTYLHQRQPEPTRDPRWKVRVEPRMASQGTFLGLARRTGAVFSSPGGPGWHSQLGHCWLKVLLRLPFHHVPTFVCWDLLPGLLQAPLVDPQHPPCEPGYKAWWGEAQTFNLVPATS